jgi:hypothetical protein
VQYGAEAASEEFRTNASSLADIEDVVIEIAIGSDSLIDATRLG